MLPKVELKPVTQYCVSFVLAVTLVVLNGLLFPMKLVKRGIYGLEYEFYKEK